MRKNVAVGIIFLVAVMAFGCAHTAPGEDPILVRSEQTLVVTFAVLDSFVRIEYQNRALIAEKAPSLASLAEQIRSRAPAMLLAANDAVDVYRRLKTQQAMDSMLLALATPEALAEQAQAALVTVARLKGGA